MNDEVTGWPQVANGSKTVEQSQPIDLNQLYGPNNREYGIRGVFAVGLLRLETKGPNGDKDRKEME
ncbi:hypothetical protein ACLOJK_000370 [Asimina triloba]